LVLVVLVLQNCENVSENAVSDSDGSLNRKPLPSIKRTFVI